MTRLNGPIMLCGTESIWNPKPGYTLEQLWADSEPAISKKTTTSYDVQANDVQRAVAAIQRFPSPIPPDSPLPTSVRDTSCPESPTAD